ncbi:hypothetical protein LguiA_031146 [Lonicera macranthoides]
MRQSFVVWLLFLVVLIRALKVCNGSGELKLRYYHKTCPSAESIAKNITWTKVSSNPSLAAKLLRLHYHDCFVRGCDASVLLDSTQNSTTKKAAPPNRSLSGYNIIDEIKTKVEEECPGVVSSVDIVALIGCSRCCFIPRAHTIGITRCALIARRLRNFAANGGADPSLNTRYAEALKTICPIPINSSTNVEMDPQSTLSFDSH